MIKMVICIIFACFCILATSQKAVQQNSLTLLNFEMINFCQFQQSVLVQGLEKWSQENSEVTFVEVELLSPNLLVIEVERFTETVPKYQFDLCSLNKYFQVSALSYKPVLKIKNLKIPQNEYELSKYLQLTSQKQISLSSPQLINQNLFLIVFKDYQEVSMIQLNLIDGGLVEIKSFDYQQKKSIVSLSLFKQLEMQNIDFGVLVITSKNGEHSYESFQQFSSEAKQVVLLKEVTFQISSPNTLQFESYELLDLNQIGSCETDVGPAGHSLVISLINFEAKKQISHFLFDQLCDHDFILRCQLTKTTDDVAIIVVTSTQILYAKIQNKNAKMRNFILLENLQVERNLANLLSVKIKENFYLLRSPKSFFQQNLRPNIHLKLLSKFEQNQLTESFLVEVEIGSNLQIKDLKNQEKSSSGAKRNLAPELQNCDETHITLEEDSEKEVKCITGTIGEDCELSYDYYIEFEDDYDSDLQTATLTFNEENDCTETFRHQMTVTAVYDGVTVSCAFDVVQHGTNSAPFLNPVPSDGTYQVSDYDPYASDAFVLDLSGRDAQSGDSFSSTFKVFKDDVEMVEADYSQFVESLGQSLSFFTDDNDLAGTYKFVYRITDSNSCNAQIGTLSTEYEFYYEILIVNHAPIFAFEIDDQTVAVYDTLEITLPGFTDYDAGETFDDEQLQIDDGGLQDFVTYPYVLSYSGNTLTINPMLNEYNVERSGTKTIYFSVTDNDILDSGERKTCIQSFVLTILPTNSAPDLMWPLEDIEIDNYLTESYALLEVDDKEAEDVITTVFHFYDQEGLENEIIVDPVTLIGTYDFVTIRQITDRKYEMDLAPTKIIHVHDAYQLCATFTDSDEAKTGTPLSTGPHCFFIEVIGINHAPYYEPSYQNLEVTVGETYYYYLPDTLDTDPLDITYTAITFRGETPSFVSITPEKDILSIFPTSNDQAGRYIVEITASDSDSERSGDILTTFAYFSIRVYEKEDNSVLSGVRKYYKELFEGIEIAKGTQPPILEIVSISNYGEVLLRWSTEIYFLEKLGPAIEAGALNISLSFDYELYDPAEVLINYNVTKIDGKDIYIQLNITDPQVISAFQEPDKLVVKIMEPTLFVSKANHQIQEKGSQINSFIPVQYKKGGLNEMMLQKGDTVQKVTSSLLLGNSILQVALSTSLNLVWSLLNTLQIIVSFPLMNMSMPQNAFIVCQIFNKIANFDVISTAKYNSLVLTFQTKEQSKIIRFRNYGFQTSNFIQNSGILFWLLLSWFFFSPFLIILNKIFKSGKVGKLVRFLHSQYFFGTLIRFLFESYYEFLLCSLANSQQPFYNYSGEILGALISISFIPILIVILIVVNLSAKLKSGMISRKRPAKRFKVLFEDFDESNHGALYYHFVFIFRRLFLALLLFFCQDYLFLQIFGFMTSSLTVFLYINQVRPYINELQNMIEQANELFVLLFCYLNLMFSDYNFGIDLQEIFGFLFIALLLIALFFNIIILIFKRKIGNYLQKKKNNRLVQEKVRKQVIQIQDIRDIDIDNDNLRNKEEKGNTKMRRKVRYRQNNIILQKVPNANNNEATQQELIPTLINTELNSCILNGTQNIEQADLEIKKFKNPQQIKMKTNKKSFQKTQKMSINAEVTLQSKQRQDLRLIDDPFKNEIWGSYNLDLHSKLRERRIN